MRYEQLHNILHHLTPNYHRMVSAYYQTLADGEVSPRVRLMLDYLIDHEQNRALALSEFCREASHHIQDQWIKGLEINFPEARPEVISPAAATDLDQLVKAAVSYKNTLIDYFGHLTDHCTEPIVLSLLQALKSQEERAMRRMIRHSQGLADL